MVCSLTARVWAIDRFLSPPATSARTSSSRVVNGLIGSRSAMIVSRTSSTIRSTRSGRAISSSFSGSSPSATRRIVATSSDGFAIRATWAVAPTSIASMMLASSSSPPRSTRAESGAPWCIRRTASGGGCIGRHIDEDDVRSRGIDDGNRLVGRVDLTNDFDVRLSVKDLAEPDPQERTRFDDDEANWLSEQFGSHRASGHGRTSATRHSSRRPSLRPGRSSRMTRSARVGGVNSYWSRRLILPNLSRIATLCHRTPERLRHP